jgi:hypothetical protein
MFNEYNYTVSCYILWLLQTYPGVSYKTAYGIALSNMLYDENKLNGWGNE